MKFRPPENVSQEQGSAVSKLLAFTLLELLVVIVIIGILATIGLPALRRMTKSNTLAAADRQLLDDIAYARRLAIGNHTSVYMVFVPPWITNVMPGDTYSQTIMTNLYQGQYTTYAMFSFRSVGDQPGQQSERYWTPWRSLPNGVYIAPYKFVYPYDVSSDGVPYAPGFFTNAFPVPSATNLPVSMPYIAFNYLGQLIYLVNGTETPVSQIQGQKNIYYYEYIPLARGSIFYPRDANGNPVPGPADIVETPAGNVYYTSYHSVNAQTNGQLPSPDNNCVYNQIYIDPLTGKARVQRQDVQ